MGGEHSRKEPFEHLLVVNSYSEHLHKSGTCLPQTHVITWTYMNTHELHQDVGACMSFNPEYWHRRGVTNMKRLDQGHLHPNLEVPRLTCPRRESNPQASTLEKSHSNSLLIAIRKIYIWARDSMLIKMTLLGPLGPTDVWMICAISSTGAGPAYCLQRNEIFSDKSINKEWWQSFIQILRHKTKSTSTGTVGKEPRSSYAVGLPVLWIRNDFFGSGSYFSVAFGSYMIFF